MLLDWSRTNYSSGRASLLEARRAFGVRQQRLCSQHLDPIYAAWVEELYLRGLLPEWVDDFYGQAKLWTACDWIGDGYRWVDPKNEGQSAAMQLEQSTTSPQIQADELGRDWRAVQRQQIKHKLEGERLENEMREEMGLDPKPQPPAAPAAGADEPEDPEQAEDEPQGQIEQESTTSEDDDE